MYFCNSVSTRQMLTRIRKDLIGMFASLLCSVHCLALPFLFIWFGVDTQASHHLAFDFIFLFLGVIFISISIIPTITRTRHTGLIFLLLFGVFSFSLSFFVGHNWNHLLFGIGGLAWAIAHFLNMYINKKILSKA